MSDSNPDEAGEGRPNDNSGALDDIVTVLKKYSRSAGRKQLAHYLAAEIDAARHGRIGVPNVILSAIVATSVFSTLSKDPALWLRIATALLALLAAILAALQAFLGFGERAEKHRAAGARYGKVRIDVDLLRLKLARQGALARNEALAGLEPIAKDLGLLETDSPTLSKSEYETGQTHFDQDHADVG